MINDVDVNWRQRNKCDFEENSSRSRRRRRVLSEFYSFLFRE